MTRGRDTDTTRCGDPRTGIIDTTLVGGAWWVDPDRREPSTKLVGAWWFDRPTSSGMRVGDGVGAADGRMDGDGVGARSSILKGDGTFFTGRPL